VQVEIVGLVRMRIGVELKLNIVRLELIETHSDLIYSAVLVIFPETMKGFGCAIPKGIWTHLDVNTSKPYF